MAENSGIAWTTHTFNTVWGCTKVSDGCKNCYADVLDKRFGESHWGPTAGRKPMSETYWKQLDKWQRKAEKGSTEQERSPRIFCNSMSDLFEGRETCQNAAAYETVEAGRQRLFEAIERTPNLTYLLLTKRPENIRKMVPPVWWGQRFPKNVWIGTSVENQKSADERIPILNKCPAIVRFVSYEPGLESVDFWGARYQWPVEHGGKGSAFAWGAGVNWIIVGGESGPNARPFDVEWARQTIASCKAAGVACFVKQLGRRPQSVAYPPSMGHDGSFSTSGGAWQWYLSDSHGGDMSEWPEDLRVRQFPEANL